MTKQTVCSVFHNFIARMKKVVEWASTKVLNNHYGSLDRKLLLRKKSLLAYNRFILDRFKTYAASLFTVFEKVFFSNLGFNIKTRPFIYSFINYRLFVNLVFYI